MPEKVTIEPPTPEICGPLRYQSRAQAENSVMSKMARLMGFKRKQAAHFPKQVPVYIFNISDQELVWREPGFERYVVPACEAGKPYSKPCVIPGIVSEEYLSDRSTEFNYYNGVEIAYAILKTGPGMKQTLSEINKGFFLSASNPPKHEELAEAVRLYSIYCDALIDEADRIMAEGESKGMNGQQINASHKRALAYRRQTRNWGRAIVEMVDCPMCSGPVAKGAAIHSGPNGCGAVIDFDKAIEFGLRKPEDRPAPPEPKPRRI
jgi:hypothetical protein